MFRQPIKETVVAKKKFNPLNIKDVPDELNEELQQILFDSIFAEMEQQTNISSTDIEEQSSTTYTIDNSGLVFSGIQQRGKPLPIVPGFGQPCTTGSKIEIKNTKIKIIIGVHWKNGTDKNGNEIIIDLDLSVSIYDENFNLVGIVDYCNLIGFDGTIRHSGDFTSAPVPDGASEYIIIDLEEFKKKYPQAKYLVPNLYSYRGNAFDEAKDTLLFVGTISENGPKGLGPEGSDVLTSFGLVGNQNQIISGVLNITETSIYFQAYGIKGNAKRTCINASNQNQWIKDTIQNFEKWASSSNSPPSKIMEELMKASMYQMVKYLSPHGEELIFNKEEGESNHDFFKRLLFYLDTK